MGEQTLRQRTILPLPHRNFTHIILPQNEQTEFKESIQNFTHKPINNLMRLYHIHLSSSDFA